MPRRRALPYRFADEALTLSVTDVTLGDKPFVNRIEANKRVVELQDRTDWTEGTVHLEARLPEGAAGELLPEDERGEPPWRIDAVLSCREAKWRDALTLDPPERSGSPWCGELTLHREALRGTLSVRAFLVRTRDRPSRPEPGFASNAGARLASSPGWKLYTDDPQAPPGEYLDIEWIDFAEELNKDSTQDIERHVYHLDFDVTPPKLYLNKRVSGLKEALDARGSHGLPPTVREVLFDSIAQTAWMTLAVSALLSAGSDDDEGDGETALDGWQKNVLKTFSNRLSQFDDLPGSLRDPSSVQPALQALAASVQDKVGMRKSTDMLLKLLSD